MYQFIHVESYSKVSAKKKLNYSNETKGRNVSDIIGEVTRKKGYCDHVEEPEAPNLLYGVHPEELEALTEDYFNNTKLTNSKGVKRGLRKDSHILLAGVVSLNRECEGFWEDYKNDSIEWLKEKYGDRLKCVVEHTDEANPHLHFYCIQNPGEDFNLLHEGKRAFQAEEKKYKKEIAFKEAMRTFQENFYISVSAKYGLMKTGPKRRRLTNEEYKRQQQEVRLINLFKNKTTEEMNILINETEKEIKRQKEKSEKEILSLKEDATALGKRIGKSLGFKSAISEFNDKNYFNKVIFSRMFGINMIEKLEKRNKDLLDKNKKLFERKEHYKKLSADSNKYKNKYEEEKKKNDYLSLINDFIDNDLEKQENKENENDIRREIIKEIDRIEIQQQSNGERIKNIGIRNDRNRAEVNGSREKFERSFRVLFSNVRSFIRDFFSVELFKRMFEKETDGTGTIEIEKYKEPEQKQKDISIKKDRKLIIKWAIRKIQTNNNFLV